MIQGTSSWSGKSLVCTALARAIARRGVRVAPFKAQNMSNNARVVAGGEIGVAQWLQARAARVEPDVRMNPVLVKPEADARSQVVVMGQVDVELSRAPWRQRPARLWPVIEAAFGSLAAEYDLVLIEGAGSPAEINLRDSDLANMRTAALADAAVLLVADIDRGGAIAHLYGTWALLEPGDRARLCGFILNKFRGEPALLEPAPRLLRELTGIAVRAVIPRIVHGLPDEDGAATPRPSRAGPRVAIVRYPAASSLDEFKALEQVARVRWATAPADLRGADLVVLPGSKHVAADLAWVRERGFPAALGAAPRVIGVCGGLQMLGGAIADPEGVEGAADGLRMLDVRSEFERSKSTRQTSVRFGDLPAPWAALRGLAICGYEIHHGRTRAGRGATAVLDRDLGFANERVLGVYLHGLFEDPGFVRALLGVAPQRSLDQELDLLADAVAEHLDIASLLEELT